MLDIIGADETIRDVYHLDLTVDDFDRSLAAARRTRICGSFPTSCSGCTTASSEVSIGPSR